MNINDSMNIKSKGQKYKKNNDSSEIITSSHLFNVFNGLNHVIMYLQKML